MTPVAPTKDEVNFGMLFVVISDHFEQITSFNNDKVCCLGDFESLAYLEANIDAGATYNMTSFATNISLGYVRTQGHNVVLMYKGKTDTATDFKMDFNTRPMYDKELLPKGFVHQGFLLAFQSSWPQVEAALNHHTASQGLDMGNLNFTMCSHSLGAVQATLAALKLAHLVAAVDSPRQTPEHHGSPRFLCCPCHCCCPC